MRKRWRALWLSIHRWLGLAAGLVFVLLGLTGSFLVFHHAIDAWLNPELLHRSEAGTSRSLAEIIAAAKEVGLQDGKLLRFADAPLGADGVWNVWFLAEREGAIFQHVYVDPVTAEVTGQRIRGNYLATWMYKLHIELLAGRRGATLVGISGILLIVSLGSGVYLWWPLWKHSWRSGFAVRGGSRFVFDLHKVLGLVGVPLLLVIAFSGVYMVFPGWFKPIGELARGKAENKPPPLVSHSVDDATPITPDRAVEIGLSQLPGAELHRVYFPTSERGVYTIRLRQPRDIRRSSGSSRVWIEQFSGKVLAVRDWNDLSAVDTFFAWQLPLHNGEAFGIAGQWVVFATGFLPAVLYGTGFWLWWRKGRIKRRRQKERQIETPHTGLRQNESQGTASIPNAKSTTS
ncbi:PepSY-associated TM helix domain-containing protein [Blastopirellula marina]|uniref:PepSY domain-containing protein n=1 Tax=Blastopirellula marina TaxID=124 RepID=A0A2S8FNB8_9BACT|nr:PepSY-associated TM helix domain-containing protein [Blastopirellula marina]PQO33698.1 PepSY domain-containing protein [Blastopirellula marina]PTL43485.1 PepSY domain-containing protein [Blastopirellula marina]